MEHRMISVKVVSLSGAALDFAVASYVESHRVVYYDSGFFISPVGWKPCTKIGAYNPDIEPGYPWRYSPSTDFEKNGQLADQFAVSVITKQYLGEPDRLWMAYYEPSSLMESVGWGPTRLIAVCRHLVARLTKVDHVLVPSSLVHPGETHDIPG
jgi:hypothetical protein